MASERSTAAGLGGGEISISFGVATSEDLDGEALLAAADRELLEAKDGLYERDRPAPQGRPLEMSPSTSGRRG